jgi:hypothetical protein
MPEITRFLGIVILMYFNEHNLPHFHRLPTSESPWIGDRMGGTKPGYTPKNVGDKRGSSS